MNAVRYAIVSPQKLAALILLASLAVLGGTSAAIARGSVHNDVGYITDRIQRLRENDAYDRLATVHDYDYCRRFPDQVDFVSVQLWSSELYGVMRTVCQAIPDKPIMKIEHGGYERSSTRQGVSHPRL